jgi:phosphoribosylformimino-5-aminoimidazole carboxamide ribotide isomerase
VIVIPSIPVRGGVCVVEVHGDAGGHRVRVADPRAVLRSWEDAGFRRVHIVDLDAVAGLRPNDRLIAELLAVTSMEVQVGGGVKTDERIERLFDLGATAVVIGTRALEDQWWLESVVDHTPEGIIVAADVRERRVVTRGWMHRLSLDIFDAIEELGALPLAGLIVTAVHRQGTLSGADLPLMEDVVDASPFPVFAAGGIADVTGLRALAERGVAGAVVGMGLYTGAIEPRVAADLDE